MPMTRGELLLGPGEVFLRLFVATLIGCVLGLNRELHGKPAGMRVHALVALGASLISRRSASSSSTRAHGRACSASSRGSWPASASSAAA